MEDFDILENGTVTSRIHHRFVSVFFFVLKSYIALCVLVLQHLKDTGNGQQTLVFLQRAHLSNYTAFCRCSLSQRLCASNLPAQRRLLPGDLPSIALPWRQPLHQQPLHSNDISQISMAWSLTCRRIRSSRSCRRSELDAGVHYSQTSTFSLRIWFYCYVCFYKCELENLTL